jgi:hypothetical protein
MTKTRIVQSWFAGMAGGGCCHRGLAIACSLRGSHNTESSVSGAGFSRRSISNGCAAFGQGSPRPIRAFLGRSAGRPSRSYLLMVETGVARRLCGKKRPELWDAALDFQLSLFRIPTSVGPISRTGASGSARIADVACCRSSRRYDACRPLAPQVTLRGEVTDHSSGF